mgnify:CR=1 FL=1
MRSLVAQDAELRSLMAQDEQMRSFMAQDVQMRSLMARDEQMRSSMAAPGLLLAAWAAAGLPGRLLGCLHERTGAQNRVVHLETAIAAAGTRLKNASERLGQMDGELAGARSGVGQMQTRAREAQQALDARDQALAGAVEDLTSAEEALERGQSELREHTLAHASLAARREALLEGGQESGGLAAGARRVLEAVDDGDGPCDAGVLQGLLADHLRVDLRLARALDAVLGEQAQALVAPGAGAAQAVLEWLVSGKNGQAEVLVPKGLGSDGVACALGAADLGRLDSPSFLAFEPYGASVEGRLCELVQCAADVRPLVDYLLGDVVVVRDLASALDLVKREPLWRYVTPIGELVSAAGAVGGSRELAQGTMGRRSMAEELGSQMQALEEVLGKDREGVTRLKQALEASRAAHGQAGSEHAGARDSAAEASGEVQSATARPAGQGGGGCVKLARLAARAEIDSVGGGGEAGGKMSGLTKRTGGRARE